MVGKTNWGSDESGDWQTGYEPQQKRHKRDKGVGRCEEGLRATKRRTRTSLETRQCQQLSVGTFAV